MRTRHSVSGMTLTEVLVGIFLLAAGMTMAVPAFSGLMERVRLKSGTDALMTGLHLTRLEAIRRNGRVVLCKSASGHMCARGQGWEQGWIVFHDVNGNSAIDPDEDVLYREPPMDPGLKVVGNLPVSNYIAYNGLGRTSLTSGAFQAGTITVCHPAMRTGDAYQIIINSYGRPRMARTVVDHCS